MARKKKHDKFEYYYCEIEEYSRTYDYGVDHSYMPDPEKPYHEWNKAKVKGKIFHIATDAPKRRNYEYLTLKLLAAEEKKEAGEGKPAIGFAEGYEGILRCYVWIPALSFASVIPSLEAGRFREVIIRVRNFRYRSGPIESVNLNTEYTDEDDLMGYKSTTP